MFVLKKKEHIHCLPLCPGYFYIHGSQSLWWNNSYKPLSPWFPVPEQRHWPKRDTVLFSHGWFLCRFSQTCIQISSCQWMTSCCSPHPLIWPAWTSCIQAPIPPRPQQYHLGLPLPGEVWFLWQTPGMEDFPYFPLPLPRFQVLPWLGQMRGRRKEWRNRHFSLPRAVDQAEQGKRETLN